MSFTKYASRLVQSTEWQPGVAAKEWVQRTLPSAGSMPCTTSLPVAMTTGWWSRAEVVTNRSSGAYMVFAPVRRPLNVSPSAGSMRTCQTMSPFSASRATISPSDHLVTTTESPTPLAGFSTATIETTSAGQRRYAQCGVISRCAVTGVSAKTRRCSV